MGILDWIIILIVAALVVLALRVYKKSGSCACGGQSCENCAARQNGACSHCNNIRGNQ